MGGLGPGGTRQGIHRLPREWGCRWYFPGELGEVVPKQSNLTMPPAVELHDYVVVFIAKNGSREIGEVDWHRSLFADANALWKTRVLDPWSGKAAHLALRDYYAPTPFGNGGT